MADEYTRRIGDRAEGRQLRTLSAYSRLVPYLVKSRGEAEVFFPDKVEVTEIDHYIREKHEQGYTSLSMQHVFLAAYVRTVSHIPGLNRFISGSRIYARHTIDAVLTVSRMLPDTSGDATVKLSLTPMDTIYDILRRLDATADALRSGSSSNSLEQFAAPMIRMPSPIVKFCVWFLNLADFFGLLPRPLLAISPFHGSVSVSDFDGIPPIHRGLYSIGNIPLHMSIGGVHREVELDEFGTPVLNRYVDYSLAIDERICVEFETADALKYFKYYLRNPELLETSPEHTTDEIF